MLKQLNIKPQDWYGTRELKWIPKHFTLISYPVKRTTNSLSWIVENTSGRYAFGTKLFKENNKVVSREILAFEDPAEATLFALSNPLPEYFTF